MKTKISLPGGAVQYADGRIVRRPPLNVDRILADFAQSESDARSAFLCALAHSLTVEIRALLFDRSVADAELNRAYQINESLHQLTSCVNPKHRRSARGDTELVRAIVESSPLYGLEASMGRALASAQTAIAIQDQERPPAPGLLEDIIRLGGRALEVEDQELRLIAQRRGRHGGLLGTEYERHYQFIVWKSLAEKYDAEIEFNYGGYLVDLVVVKNGVPTIFEMKFWREESANKIYADILRLQSFPDGGFLLVFSGNPKELTDENIQLISGLSGISGPVCSHRFATENQKGDTSYEFWFAGWPVHSRASRTDA